ncbi:hypothetical protein HWV62_19477 [Athelia sp. TMB]|nr:hypothetical protein HWV62_19477 [Athelia sp. TMB]
MLYLDSRRNLVFRERVNPVFIAASRLMLDNPVKSDWHGAFEEQKWLFLPDTAALHEAHQYVADVLSWRENAESPRVEEFNLKWQISGLHDYRFIPIAGLERESFAREDTVYCHPFRSLPTISCHITPLFAIINAAITLENHTLRDLVVSYSKDTDEQAELEHKLDIVRKIWALLTGARLAARNWSKSRKRPRDDHDRPETSSCSSRYTMRTLPRTSGGNTDYGQGPARRARSASARRSAGGSRRQPDSTETSSRSSRYTTRTLPRTSGGNTDYEQGPARRGRSASTRGLPESSGRQLESPSSRSRTRKRGSSGSESILTADAVLHLGKSVESEHPQKRIRSWLAGQEREA